MTNCYKTIKSIGRQSQSLKMLGIFTAIIMLMLPLISSSVSALSPKQKKLLNTGIYYFDAEAGGICQPGLGTGTPTSLNLGAIASKYKLHSAIVQELGGSVIDAYKADETPPAVSSVLKILIADVYLSENPNLSETITVRSAQLYDPGTSGDFSAGQRVPMTEVLQKTLSESSNTGANILMDESGGHNSATAKARELGYSANTRISAYYKDPGGSSTPNQTTVADLSKAMDKIFSQSTDGYKQAQAALRVNDKKWGLDSDANKWGGNSQVTGNSALFENINGKSYIITMYISMDWEGDNNATTASGPIAIKNSTNEVLAALQSLGESATGSSFCCVSGANLVGSEEAEMIWNFLRSNIGLTAVQAAGIMGNIQQESGFSPTALNPSSGAYGIVQWYAGRRIALENFAASKGVDKSDLGMQLEFLEKELNEGYKASVLDPIKASSNLEEITRIWLERFEVPCIPGSSECAKEMTVRLPFAVNILSKYGSTDVPTASSATCSENSQGEVIGEYSLPVDKKWYLSDPEWFSKPHHNNNPASDIPVPLNTPIYSMSAGKVISAPTGGNCGRGLVIDAGDGIQFTYCHGMDGGSVAGARNGDSVSAGQMIMRAGYTGRVSPPGRDGTHLHLEISVDGRSVCPQPLLIGVAQGKIPDIKSLTSSGCTS